MLTDQKKKLIFDYHDLIYKDPVLARVISFRTIERIVEGGYSYREFLRNAIQGADLSPDLYKRLRGEWESF